MFLCDCQRWWSNNDIHNESYIVLDVSPAQNEIKNARITPDMLVSFNVVRLGLTTAKIKR